MVSDSVEFNLTTGLWHCHVEFTSGNTITGKFV